MESDIVYLKGFINPKDRIAVIGASERLDEDEVDHAFVAIWKEKEWATSWDEEFSIVSAASGLGKQATAAVLMGMTGEVRAIDAQGNTTLEKMGRGNAAPNRLRTMHEVRAIGEGFYAVGMRRQVFRRNVSGGNWQKIDVGVFVPDTSKEIAGFLSVDGFDESEVYAVGYSGEIWQYNGKTWRKIDSPTNLRLESIRCCPDGRAVACGDAGVILRGRGDSWEVIEQDVTEESILSAACLGDRIYLATEDGTILTLKGKSVKPVKISTSKSDEPTTGFLDSNGKRLISIGATDVLVFDGKKWQSLSDPPFESE
jgi:hypothetical protein